MPRVDDPRHGSSRGPTSASPASCTPSLRTGPTTPATPPASPLDRLASPWLPGRSIDGRARILRQGILDHDATVLELLPKRTYSFWGRASTFQSFALPIFDTRDVTSAVVSLAVSSLSGFLTGSRMRVHLENATQTRDDSSVIFAEPAVTLVIQSTPAPPTVQNAAWPTVGPGGRLRLEWQQGSTENTLFPAVVTFSVLLTLRRG